MAVNLPIQNFYQPTVGPNGWVRPADWPTITDTANEVQFLVGDMFAASFTLRTTFTRVSGSQNITIDWGDGTTNVISTTSATNTIHQYTAGTGTPCSLGYTTFKIRVYLTGTGVSTIDNCIIYNVLLTGDTVGGYKNCALLEAYYGNNTQTTVTPFYSSNSNASLSYYYSLQYIKLPVSVSWIACANIFNGCQALSVVVMPTSAPNITTFNSAFQSCINLLEIVMPSNATGITTLASAFSNCFNLKKVTLPTSLNSCATIASAFGACSNLQNITIPSINVVTNATSAFANATQLAWVKFSSLPTSATVIDFGSCFSTCSNLQNVYFPATCNAASTYSLNSIFQSCTQLKSVVLPSNMNVSNFGNAFNTCSTLNSCVLPNSTPACTTISGVFSNCSVLTNIVLPSTVSATVDMSSAFGNCLKLQTITIPSSYTFSSLLGTFSGCVSLKTLNWNPGIQNSLTSMNLAFNGCRLLTSITLPSSMNLLNNLASAFAGCVSLTSLTFPSSLNAVTTIANICQGCTILGSITLPTSMSACTNFNAAFSSCILIRSVTLPNTVSASATSFNGTFGSCNSLETIVFPGSQQLALVNDIGGAFSFCTNLKTITNFDKIGALAATPLVSMGSNTNPQLLSLSISCPLSILTIPGTSAQPKGNVQSIRLLNSSAGQWTGGSPQINVSYTTMTTAQLVQLFTDMAAQGVVVSKTINITSATGAAGLTAADRLLITSKGWTITG